MKRICFVCTGNICRSPTGEGVLRHLLKEAGIEGYEVSSAGTISYHVGELPDPRTRATAKARGVVLESKAQHFVLQHLDHYDLVLALDRSHLKHLQSMVGKKPIRAKIQLVRAFDPEAGGDLDVPDPYYGGQAGFDEVYDIVFRACQEIVRRIKAQEALC